MGLRAGSITFGGIASGIPTNEIIEKLIELERRPIDLLENRKADFELRLGIYQDLSNKTRNLRDALRKIDNMNSLNTAASAFEEFNRFRASSTNEDVVSALASPTATPGSLTLRVDQRAQGDREVSQRFGAVTDVVGTGSVTIDVGSTSPTSTVVTIDSSNNTVEGLVQAINDSDAEVRAFLLTDSDPTSPIRIVVQSKTTGAEQAVALGVSLSGGTAPSFTETQTAQDAQITLDPASGGVTLTSTTNQFAEVTPGLSITAETVSAEVVTVNVEQDPETMATGIQSLVDTYNDIIGVISEQFEVDPTTNRGGPLIGDSSLITLKNRLSSVLAQQIGSGGITIASQIGLEQESDGKLSFDQETFEAAVASDPDGVRAFFSGPGSLADQLARASAGMVDPVNGLLVARINGTSASIRDIDEQIADAEDRLEVVESNLVRQFSALEQRVSQLQQQGNFLTQFLFQSVT